MKSVGLPIAAGLLCLLPAACSETASQPPAVSAPTVGTPAADAAMRTGSSADEKACLKTVERETRNHAVAVLSSEFSQANTEVVIGVGQ